jgi:hypothetical protein
MMEKIIAMQLEGGRFKGILGTSKNPMGRKSEGRGCEK